MKDYKSMIYNQKAIWFLICNQKPKYQLIAEKLILNKKLSAYQNKNYYVQNNICHFNKKAWHMLQINQKLVICN
ncbi:hypothetical protein [Alkalitalea saponilacus]|uniref:hypothetical protein n=1 Tax=Alkalitalea saponilacus TaxID=889453 RepID=UPI001178CA5B|nr:hypothetical protein [Alkalitalea saponilacus]